MKLALRSLDESDRLGRDWHARVINDFLRAIALARLGRAGEARPVYESGALYVDAHLASTPAAPFGEIAEGHAWDWYAIRLLRGESQTLLLEARSDRKLITQPPGPARSLDLTIYRVLKSFPGFLLFRSSSRPTSGRVAAELRAKPHDLPGTYCAQQTVKHLLFREDKTNET